MVKHQPTMQETWVQSLCREDLLEKGVATHSCILAPPHQKKGAQRNTHYCILTRQLKVQGEAIFINLMVYLCYLESSKLTPWRTANYLFMSLIFLIHTFTYFLNKLTGKIALPVLPYSFTDFYWSCPIRCSLLFSLCLICFPQCSPNYPPLPHPTPH